MANETMIFCKFSKNDDRLKKWWTELPDRQASNHLRRAVNFYLSYFKWKSVIDLIIALDIDPETAKKIIRRHS